jgi:TRAP-type C4-dicarboxylate transport system permease small subunit
MRDPVPSDRSKLRILTDRAEAVLLWIFTVMLIADVLLGILARYIQFDMTFADELGKYLFIWLCTVGVSAAAKDNQHVRLSFIASRLPLPEKFVALISQTVFLGFALLLLYWSARLTWMHFVMEKTAMGFPVPMYPFTAALPVGFGLTSLRIIQDIFSLIKTGKHTNRAQEDPYAIKEL